MAREIMKPPVGMQIDHINHDTLNNQRENLRICTPSQNNMNKAKRKDNTSGYKGVCWQKEVKKWQAKIKVNQKQIYLGCYDNKELAYEAYIKACKKYHKEFANY